MEIAEPLRQRVDKGFRRNDVLREAAVHRPAGESSGFAEILFARQAVLAFPAGLMKPWNTYPRASLEPLGARSPGEVCSDLDNQRASMRSLPVTVDPATRANLGNDDIKALDVKKDSKTTDPRRSPVVLALQGFRVLRVERIDHQLFELLLQPVTGRRVTPPQVFRGWLRY